MANEEIESEARALLARIIPSLEIARLDVTDSVDSDGEPSLRLKIVARQRPPRDDTQNMPVFVDQLRTWLALRKDERFPYVRLITESEERELQHAE